MTTPVAVQMSDETARKLGCERVPFDAGGYPIPLDLARATFLVRTRGGAWMFWDFVPDETANVCDNE